MRRPWLLLALFLSSFASAPAAAAWLRAESPNFIVYGEMSGDRLRNRVELLEEFDAFLRILTGTTTPPAPNKLRVYLTHGSDELSAVWPMGRWVGGFYRASPEGVFAVADEYADWRGHENQTLLHEYAHHFMMQYHPAPYPSWYVEGFADFVMTAEIRPDYYEFGDTNPVRSSWLTASAPWMAYEDLLFGDLTRVRVGSFYAQSWLLVHYIMSDESRRRAFVRYVEAVARGEAPRTAFTAAFGMDGPALDQAMRQYARRIPIHRIDRRSRPAPPAIAIESLEAAGLNPPLIEAALMLDLPSGHGRRVLNRARRAGHGDDIFGERLQAKAEILLGDLAVADRLLAPLLAAAPNDPEVLYLHGLRHLVAGRRNASARAAEYRAAQRFFARAFRADPNHYPSLFRYAEALSTGDQFLTENTQNVLLLATSLAPQVSEIRLAAAHVLLLRDKFAEAEALLLPLSTSVHDPRGGERAAEFLRLARAHQRPSDGVVFKVPDAARAN
ncbi:MAG TPA: hypothetical protein VF704_10125 [Allosphingosinicella sp.]